MISPQLAALQSDWLEHWPAALALWSRFTRLSEPRWCFDEKTARAEGLTGSFAMIRLNDHAVVIALDQVRAEKLDDFAVEILAHEIGHHVLCPANLGDHARGIARMRRGLPTKEHLAPFISNLYTDLLINDRLQRGANLRMAAVYQALDKGSTDRLWTLYMRIYEILWSLDKGSLAAGHIDNQLEGDAVLGSRVVRAYAGDWLRGAGRFAALCLPYLLENDGEETRKIIRIWLDTQSAGGGQIPDGLSEMDDDEESGAIHPALDEELSGVKNAPKDEAPQAAPGAGGSRGQHREPFEYGDILKSLGVNLSDHDIAVRYYRERATPHLVRFPSRRAPQSSEPLLEGFESWELGFPIEEIDWLQSAILSPHVVPGLTTLQRTYGTSEGGLPAVIPLDLDLYIDCSGSMPNPQVSTSYLTLAGAIITLSALRAGARVQATLWSGKHDFQTTGDFIRDENALLRVLTGYIGGSTAFPIHLLRDTYLRRGSNERPAHILVVSDDGVTTMFDKDEKGRDGWEVCRQALQTAAGGGTMVLNLWREIEQHPDLVRARQEGWSVWKVQTWEDLIAFAQQFSRSNYGKAR